MSYPSSPIVPDPRNRNACTWIPDSTGRALLRRPRALTATEAYSLARAAEQASPAQSAPGYRLYWIAQNVLAYRDIPANKNSLLILGRHTHCDVVLEGDPTVALRHLVVRCSVLDDGCPVLSVLDLHTHEGFELSDGTTQRSVVGKGALVLRVGAYRLVALPSDSPPPAVLPPTQCDFSEVHPYRAPAPRFEAPAKGQRPSRITLLPRIVNLGESFAIASSRAPQEYSLTLTSRLGCASVGIAPETLDLGLLLGRSPRCLDQGLLRTLNINISRVHLLILRDRSGIAAYDTASTQGTYLAGAQVRRVPLSGEETLLHLGALDPLELRWRVARR